jgi:Fe-S cluster biogenesis protein NfuA
MAGKVSVSLEFTPNPNTLKFVVGQQLLEKGAANFADVSKASPSPMAQKLFAVPGVKGVLIGTNFVTITKGPEGDWDVVAEEVPKTLESFLTSGTPIFEAGFDPAAASASSGTGSDVEKRIKEVLDNEIRPAVAMDGGDITFGKFEDGIVYLHLQGACSTCPSSIATLKMGVETRLKEVVPEVKEVVQV